MKKMAFSGLAGFLFLLLAPLVLADNTVCTGAIPLTPDGTIRDGTFTAGGEARWFTYQAKPDRSYAWMIENTNPTDNQALVCSFGRVLDTCTGTAVPITATSNEEPNEGTTGAKIAHKSTGSDLVFFSVNQCSGTAPTTFRVRVVETTLANPLFSTFSGFNTFYRFVNTTNQNVSVTLKLISDAGAVVGNSTFTVNANSTAPTRNTGATDLNVAPNTAGQAIITYDGTPGAIQVDGFLGNFATSPPIVLPIKIVPAREQR